jgi:hypothetical protein
VKLSAIAAAAAATLITSLANAAPLTDAEWCAKAVDELEKSFWRCSKEGIVVDADGSPGSYGTGCTLDHVLAFAGAYADVLHCAMAYHDAASIRELHQLREMAKSLSSPAAQKHLAEK